MRRRLGLAAAAAAAMSAYSTDGGDHPAAGAGEAALSAAAAAAERCAASFAAGDEFSGVLLIERQRKRLAAESYGTADPATGARNSLDTPFNIASVGKIFTSTAVGQLIERGKLKMDDPIGRHLPGLPAELAAVTVRQLLSHSSGVGNIFTPAHAAQIRDARTSGELVHLIGAQPPAFAPGTDRAYSNAGYVLLGAVIEAVSGQSYADYVHERIFTPAGMTASSLKGAPPGAARMLTRSHDLSGAMRIERGVTLPRRAAQVGGGAAYGGGYSSALDLARFAEAMRTDRLLSPATKALLWSDPAPLPGAGPGEYAHGFQLFTEAPVRVVGHSGLAGGANAEFHWAPEEGWTLVVLSNFDPMAATMIANAAKLALTGLETPETACEAAKRGRGMPMPMGPPPGPGAPQPDPPPSDRQP